MFELNDFLEIPSRLTWRDCFDIVLMTLILYKSILLVKGTRALAMLLGLGLMLILYYLAIQLELYTIRWLLEHIVGSLFIVLIVLFQKDIRQGLGELGSRYFWSHPKLDKGAVEEIITACEQMAHSRTGALIVIQCNVPLEDMIRQEGVRLNAEISHKLLQSIFMHTSPLHDGAVIIVKSKLSAASCILPLAIAQGKNFGTRHRAALGITSETDAIAIVVSEERGEISIARRGELFTGLNTDTLREVITNAL